MLQIGHDNKMVKMAYHSALLIFSARFKVSNAQKPVWLYKHIRYVYNNVKGTKLYYMVQARLVGYMQVSCFL